MDAFTIFGRKGCGFCVRARELCEERGFPFKYIDIHEEGITKADLEKTIGKPVETVPQVFHGATHIGGFTEMDAYVRANNL